MVSWTVAHSLCYASSAAELADASARRSAGCLGLSQQLCASLALAQLAGCGDVAVLQSPALVGVLNMHPQLHGPLQASACSFPHVARTADRSLWWLGMGC